MNVSLKAIDDFLDRLETAKNDDELRLMFAGFNQDYQLEVPPDPFSDEYKAKQFAFYEYLHGSPYSPNNEVSEFDVADMAVRPFPYCHQSSELVGNQLLAIGFVVKAMGLPPGARILEFGPGWGNTTLVLAKMGYQVTAFDIEQNFVDLINRRAAMEQLDLKVARGDFSIIKETTEKYDAILFFECFHHAEDHLGLIAAFDRVLNPGGLICFGAEPILDDFPIPWGLRMDGESLWAIRKNGWLELGFNRDYFDEALSRHGFVAVEHLGSDGPWSKALIAKRASEMVTNYSFESGKLRHAVGRLGEAGLEITPNDHGYAAYGPYERLPKGGWQVEVVLDQQADNAGDLILDVVDRGGQIEILQPTTILVVATKAIYTVDFVSPESLEAFEIRVLSPGGTRATIKEIKLRYRGSGRTKPAIPPAEPAAR